MRRLIINIMIVILVMLFITNRLMSQSPKPIVLDPAYHHDKYNTQPKDLIFSFRAYMVSFDSNDDNNDDGKGDSWGIPEWVSYEIKAVSNLEEAPDRPGWFTDNLLYEMGIAPKDDSYRYSREFRAENPNWFDRGHMCMKFIAWRLGPLADYNTHTLLNACPQRHDNNDGIWKDMEFKTMEWADKYGAVWVICGPIVNNSIPTMYIGELEKGELPVVVPDAFFKIVIKESGDVNRPDVLALIYPQDTERGDKNHDDYLVSVDNIEQRTGLDFLTILEDDIEEDLEKWIPTRIWEDD